MNHTGTKTLETKRLILRRFTVDDAEDMWNNWAGDDETTHFMNWAVNENVEFTKEVLKGWVQSYEKLNTYNWAIVLKDGNKLIGSIGLATVCEENRSGDGGYIIAKDYWNQGYTSEAYSRVIDYLLTSVGFNRIESKHHVDNPNSGKVMMKCGMKYEGELRQFGVSNKGELYDCKLYSILKEDLAK